MIPLPGVPLDQEAAALEVEAELVEAGEPDPKPEAAPGGGDSPDPVSDAAALAVLGELTGAEHGDA